ncbi:serine acetyltransferase [Pseudoduganella sp. FT93W]|uniref:Serine acetyltransferase n=1 Tax=Duganella fentianensis TaxID=2692177 RepID=A0A845I2K0_9BURK|nr:DapH/DapD/GlmU-related protein [Duganella fentianensis]MYN47362.1 serine acetyltransferase [Duganella fentianensis]
MTSIFSLISADYRRYYALAGGSRLRRISRCLLSPGFQAVTVYRIGHWTLHGSKILKLPVRLVYVLANLLIKICWGIDIEPDAKIGAGLYIGHFGGINISGAVVMGHSCNISQSITLGVAGAGDKFGAPVIGDEAYIAPGVRAFGKIRIGNNVKLGANAVIHADIPDNAVVVLEPGFKIISLKGNRRRAQTPG